MTPACKFLRQNLNLAEATGYPAAKWEPFQLAHLNYTGLFRIENKSRQIAWSWTTAAEAVAHALLYGRSSLFQSINLNEAKEKIRYAKDIIRALPETMRPRLTLDNQQEIEIDNKARIYSLPGNPQRGKARYNVYLDEFAHIKKSRLVYVAALPVVTKGGVVRVGSSPMGAGNMFWEIWKATQGKYTDYSRAFTPWWQCYSMTTDLNQAIANAPHLDTKERVYTYGNDRIKMLFGNMLLDDFKQEFEGEAVDDKTAWIPWEEIRSCQDPDLECIIYTTRGTIGESLAKIDELKVMIRANRCEGAFCGGFDVGRTNNTSELVLLGLSAGGRMSARLIISLDNLRFDDQLMVLDYALRNLPIIGLAIDRNGLGMNIAETLESYWPTKAAGVTFTNQSKSIWAVNVKSIMQRNYLFIPVDRDLAYQLHSLRRKVTAAANMVFDVESDGKHHADKFWALALAATLATAYTQGVATNEVKETPRQRISAY